ncbi:MAG: hypothetical protein AB7K24_09625 [Gemmataceae bacterium]
MARMLVLTVGLVALIMIGLMPPRRYSLPHGGSQLVSMIEPYAHGKVPTRQLVFSSDIYTMWHDEGGIPVEIDTGRLLAEGFVVVGATGFGLVIAASLPRKRS